MLLGATSVRRRDRQYYYRYDSALDFIGFDRQLYYLTHKKWVDKLALN
jgi:hypothetical protein